MVFLFLFPATGFCAGKTKSVKTDMTDVVMQKIAFAPFTGDFALSGETVYLKQYDVYLDNLRGTVKYDLGKFLADNVSFQFLSHTFRITGQVFPEFAFSVKCDEFLPVVDICNSLIRNQKVRSITDVLLLSGEFSIDNFSVKGTLDSWKVYGELQGRGININLKPFSKWIPFDRMNLTGGIIYSTDKVMFRNLRLVPDELKKEAMLNGEVNIIEGFPVAIRITSDLPLPLKYFSTSEGMRYLLQENYKTFGSLIKGGTVTVRNIDINCDSSKQWDVSGVVTCQKAEVNLQPFRNAVYFSKGVLEGELGFNRQQISLSGMKIWLDSNQNPLEINGKLSSNKGFSADLHFKSADTLNVTPLKRIFSLPEGVVAGNLEMACDLRLSHSNSITGISGEVIPAGTSASFSGIPVKITGGNLQVDQWILSTENLVFLVDKNPVKCRLKLNMKDPSQCSAEIFTPDNIDASSLKLATKFFPETADMLKKISGPLRLSLSVEKGEIKSGYVNCVSLDSRELGISKFSGKIEFSKNGFSGEDLTFQIHGLKFTGDLIKGISGKTVFDFAGNGLSFKGSYGGKANQGLTATLSSSKSINVSVLNSFASLVPGLSELLSRATGSVRLELEVSDGVITSGYVDANNLNLPAYEVSALNGRINIAKNGMNGPKLDFKYKTLPLTGSMSRDGNGNISIRYSNSNLPLISLSVFDVAFIKSLLTMLDGYLSLKGSTVISRSGGSESSFLLNFANCGLKDSRIKIGQGSVSVKGEQVSLDLRNLIVNETISGTINRGILDLNISGKGLSFQTFRTMFSKFYKFPEVTSLKKGIVDFKVQLGGKADSPSVNGNITVRDAEMDYQNNFILIKSLSINIAPNNKGGFNVSSGDSTSAMSFHYIPANQAFQRLYFPVRNLKFQGEWSGNRLKIPTLTCVPGYSLQDQGVITLSDLQVMIGTDISYSFSFAGSQLNVSDFANNNTPLKDAILTTGTINGKVQGNSSSIETLSGEFNVAVSGGYFNKFPPFMMLSSMLHAPVLSYEKIQAADARFQIKNHHFILQGANAQCADIHISGHGQISFDTSLDLKLVIYMAPTAFIGSPNKIPADVLRKGVNFSTKVRGTIMKPSIKPDFSAFALFPVMNAPLLSEADKLPEGVPETPSKEEDKKINIFDLLLKNQ